MQTADLLLGRRVRQNHALEHGTVTILTRRVPGLAVSARSTTRGFTIFADLDTGLVRAACAEALHRLHRGEAELAIHPNCGTNIAVGTSLAMLGSLFGLTAVRTRTRIASALVSTLAGFAAARPLGSVLQRHVTTLPDLHDVRILAVTRRRAFGRRVIEVLTTSDAA
jgi:hypothetical protein